MQGKHRVMRLVKKALSPGFVLEAVWGQRAGKGPSQTCAVSGMGLLRGSGLGTLLSVMCGEEGLRLKSEYRVGVKLIPGWPQHSRHNYGKAIISIIELLCSCAVSPWEPGERQHSSSKGKRDSSVKSIG